MTKTEADQMLCAERINGRDDWLEALKIATLTVIWYMGNDEMDLYRTARVRQQNLMDLGRYMGWRNVDTRLEQK